ncbi:MAG: hypothetical protein EA412_10305 [Chitinophagaceae bacterium]|nr:MAG: hypothetical protein EA412_10305 [Chitinophagaceae bacterium]
MQNNIKLPKLSYKGFEKSKLTLHLFFQIIGKTRLSYSHRKNHWWYVTLYADSRGFTTGPVFTEDGLNTFTISLNIHTHQIEIFKSTGENMFIELTEGMTIADFYNQYKAFLNQLDIQFDIHDKPYDMPVTKKFSEITEYKHYNKEYSKDLWKAFLWIDGVFKEFSGRFYGKTCPVHLYWHSMDLAVTRFSGKEAPKMPESARLSDKDAYSHECISFGFWAGDDNMQEPAFYSYTYPSPEGIEKQNLLPEKAEWIDSNGSPMAILRYSDLLKSSNPRVDLLDFLESAYQAGASLADWPVKKLTVPPLSAL